MKAKHLIPFGILESQKPRHFREMAKVAWENRHDLPYAWKVLNHGVCDGCSLGPYGLKDNVIDGVHLCLTRLKLLKLNTAKPFDPQALPTLKKLRTLSNEQLHELGRLSVPLRFRKGDDRLTPISWDAALDRIASAMKIEQSADSSDRIGFFVTSRGLTNETYYLSRKLAALAGTNNIDLCARLCHAASVDGLKDTVGVPAPTCSLSDVIGSDLVVIFGSNLANNQPVMTKYLHYAKKQGTKILVVNPYREPGLERYWVPSIPSSAVFGTPLMDGFFPVSIGGDIAFIYGVLKYLFEMKAVDQQFIEESTAGFETLKARIESFDWDTLVQSSGVTKEDMQRFARLYSQSRTAVFIYSMGLTQHRFGVDNVKAIVNLALSRGMLGREKCGIIPIRGHSGVQGGGECGVDPGKFPGGFPVNEENVARFERAWGEKVAAKPGLRTLAMLEAAYEGKLSVLYNIGGNLLETMPDRTYMKQALERVSLRVHQDLVLNSSTVLEGDEVILLPTQTRYEQKGGGTSTSTERRIRFTPEISGHQVGEAKAEWEILAEIGRRLFPKPDGPFTYYDTQSIRNEMGQVMPIYAGIEKLKKEGDHLQWGGPHLFADGRFDKMPQGRALFTAVDVPDTHIPEGKVYVTTRRGKQFNSMTYGTHDPLTNHQRHDIFVAREDAHQFNLKDGDGIRLESELGHMDGVCRIAPIRARNVQVHWPEGNVLIGRRTDPVSGEPDYNTYATLKPLR